MSLDPAPRRGDSEFPTTLTVAVVQFLPTTGVPDASARNLDRMAGFVARAHAAGAKLVLFPELGTCGYGIAPDEVARAVDAAPAVVEVCPSCPSPAIQC
jgi:predicted amidohydrolase